MARKNKEPKLPAEGKPAKVKKAKVKKQPKELEQCGSRVIGNPVRVLIITAVISALIGFALVQFYEQYKAYIDYIVGGVIMLVGLVSIIFYFAKRMFDGVYRSEFAIGVLCLAFGLYVALNGGVSFSFLIIIGALCALDGVIKLQYTLDLARMRFKAWWLTLIFAILGIAVGVVILMGLLEDVFGAEQIFYTGIALCGNALFDIICAITIFVRNRKAAKARKNAGIKYYSSNPEAAVEPVPAAEESPEAADEAEAAEEAGEDISVEILPEEELSLPAEAAEEACPAETAEQEPCCEQTEPAAAEKPGETAEPAAEQPAEPADAD